jgi:hypothetical protein
LLVDDLGDRCWPQALGGDKLRGVLFPIVFRVSAHFTAAP